jgi:hypothetical protein
VGSVPSFHRNSDSVSLRYCKRLLATLRPGQQIAADQRLTMIQGKTISIAGVVRLHEGKPEIEIVSADQIKG